MKTNGPGKYDYACTLARSVTEAQGVVLMILEGRYGAGFSVQCGDPAMLASLPSLLRKVADDIERSMLIQDPPPDPTMGPFSRLGEP